VPFAFLGGMPQRPIGSIIQLMFRLLALLQLTRAALAFTAIADAWTVLLLRPPSVPADPMWLLILRMIITGVVSACLYGFGMALNDLLDARRDRIFARHRPIPSGRIGWRTAIITALLLMMTALFAAAMLMPLSNTYWPLSFLLAFATALLIVFYDATSKYLGGLGLLTLGLVRAIHCMIGNPQTPLLFLSMLLLTHVALISLVAYRYENKRPRLKWWDVATVITGLVVLNTTALAYMYWRGALVTENLPMLIGPGIAALVYLLWATFTLRQKKLTPRQRGERLILMGLFWLFIYDASILVSNGQYLAGVAITLLLVCAIVSFFGLRWLGRRLTQPRLTYRASSQN